MSTKLAAQKQWVLVVPIVLTFVGIIMLLVWIGVRVVSDHTEASNLEALRNEFKSELSEKSQDLPAPVAADTLPTATTTTSTLVAEQTTTAPILVPSTTQPQPAPSSTTTTTTVVLPVLLEYPDVDELIASISIPRIGMSDWPTQMGDPTKASTPKKGELRVYYGYRLPGEGSVVGVGGHRTSATSPFYGIDTLMPGDRTTVVTNWGVTYEYEVINSTIVPDVDTQFYDFAVQTDEAQTAEVLLLYSCGDNEGNPGGTATRVIVTSLLVDSFLTPSG